ncbi:MAG: hypothetical protein PWP23_2388 [Candidatus Sumerlaeota bacterium]|nr:hypothetical protein [Candidatus Sumerlaeota bacterium]
MRRLLFLILALFASPIAVGILEGITFHFWLNLALWFLTLSTLGVVHSWWLILTRDYPAFHS